VLCQVFNKTTDHDDGFLDLYHVSSWGADCSLLLNADHQWIIDQQTEPWDVKVTAVAVKDVDLPQEMQRAIVRRSFTLKANSKPPNASPMRPT
jgi:hypothetical protein